MPNDDAEIRNRIEELRYATIEQLEPLLERQTLWRRLKVKPPAPLLCSKQVYSKRFSLNEPYVYAVHDITRRKDSFDHEMITTWVHVGYIESGKLIAWFQPFEKKKDQINEDALALVDTPLDEGESEDLDQFIESDTGSEGKVQIEDKLRRYVKYWKEEQKPFQVLFVVRKVPIFKEKLTKEKKEEKIFDASKRRVENLQRRACAVVPRDYKKFFLFTTLHEVKTNFSGEICSVAHSSERLTVIPV